MPTIVGILTFINCWHFNIYERENSIFGLAYLKKAEFLDILYLRAFKISCSTELSREKVLQSRGLIVLVPDHCLLFNFVLVHIQSIIFCTS